MHFEVHWLPPGEPNEGSVIKTHVSRCFLMIRATPNASCGYVTGGRSSAIKRRMSANMFLGMAISAIWNAT